LYAGSIGRVGWPTDRPRGPAAGAERPVLAAYNIRTRIVRCDPLLPDNVE